MDATHWLGNLAAWSAQSAVLIAAGGAAAWAFRIRVPRVRLAYWHALLILCLLLPALEPWRTPADGRIEITMGPARTVASNPAPAPTLPWRGLLLVTLALGSTARAGWLAAGLGKLRRWRRASRPFAPLPPHLHWLRAALAPRAEFAVASGVSGPVTFGLLHPLIVLPAGFTGMPVTSQEAIACHELLHVRRHDWAVTLAEECLRALLWFHPAVWWVTGQIQLAREQAVDAGVVRFTHDRRKYLDALLAMAGDRPALDLAPATLFLRKRHLKKRVALLLEEVTMSKRTLISFCAASSGVLMAAGWLALHTFPLQAAPQEDSAKLLHSVAPKYPPAAREKHIEGDVVLEVQIDAEGHVADAHVLSGPQELRRAALEAILQWHYSPKAMSLPTTTQVTMTFKLPKDGAPSTMIPAPPPIGQPFTLKAIRIDGLSDSARDELMQRLPVHAGDTVDQDVMRSLAKVARDFDDHLIALAGRDDGTIHIFLMPPVPPPPAGGGPPRIRVGGNVQQAKLAKKVQPVYPPEAKAARVEGVVRLEATIGKDGSVENLVLLSGDPLLAPAALDAVRQWQYQTTLLNGDPVEVITEIDVNFTLAK